jgi:Domain of unknown function (DUF4260)
MLEGSMKRLLQLEGAVIFAGGLMAYHWLGSSWWMFVVLFLAPDLSFSGYLLGPRFGAIAYNLLHSTIGPFLLAAVSWWMEPQIITLITGSTAAIWFAHIGLDRALGYGLKYSSGFKDTHLGKL